MKYLKKKVILYLLAFLLCGFFAFLIYHIVYNRESKSETGKEGETSIDDVVDKEDMLESKVLEIEIDGVKYNAILEDNETSLEFFNMTPLDVVMNDLNNNEKYYDLGVSLTGESNYTGEIHRGDIMLYNNSIIVIFYEDFETQFNYIRIGHIDNMPALNNDKVEVKFVR